MFPPPPLPGRVNAIVFPSGDQLWKYEFGVSVSIRGAAPPATGTTYTRRPGFPVISQVAASSFPSGENPWLPEQFVNPPRSISRAWLRSVPFPAPSSTGTVHSLPSRVNSSDFPSRLQLGASIDPCVVITTKSRRASGLIEIVCSVLYSVIFPEAAPASSAVGLFQTIDGAYTEARGSCVRDNVVVDSRCGFESLTFRVIPSHAIELTAVYLDRHVAATLARAGVVSASPAQKQDLAAFIHLCGSGPATAYARRRFHMIASERCGDHLVAAYVAKVDAMKREFLRLAGQSSVKEIGTAD